MSGGLIPPEIVDKVLAASDIVDVIGSYVPLTKSGSKYKALSPFNREKTPSFYVNPSLQIFKCFSSGHGGNVFKFLMLLENLSFPEAVRRLAQRAHIDIPDNRDGTYDPAAKTRAEELRAAHGAIADWWHEALLKDPQAEVARAYLKNRDFSLELAQEFRLGYAPDTWEGTLTWAREKGFSMEVLQQGGLVATSESGRTYDFFKGRLTIPICDESGQVVAFSGRQLYPDVKSMKYKNSPETPIFTKGKVLFGLNKTKKAILDADQVILCEGQIDLMRCWSAGIKNVVAPQGTALTPKQCQIMKRLAKEAILCFDSDNAGQKAAGRSVDLLLAEGLSIRVVQMPAGEDPDSFLRKRSPSEFQALIKGAQEYTRFLLDGACRSPDFQSGHGKGLVAAKMAHVLVKIPNPVQRETFLIEVAGRLQVSRSVMEVEMKRAQLAAEKAAKSAQYVKNLRDAMPPPAKVIRLEPEPESGSQSNTGPLAPVKGEMPASPAQSVDPEAEMRMEPPDLTGPGPLSSEEEFEQHQELDPEDSSQDSVVDPLIETVLAFLLMEPDYVTEMTRRFDPVWLDGYSGGELLLLLLQCHADDAWQGTDHFVRELASEHSDYLTGLLMEPPSTPDWKEVKMEAYLDQLLTNLQRRWARSRLTLVEQRIRLNDGDLGELFKEMFGLKKVLGLVK